MLQMVASHLKLIQLLPQGRWFHIPKGPYHPLCLISVPLQYAMKTMSLLLWIMSIKLLTLPSGIICPMEVLCPELSGNAHHEQQN